MAAQQLSRYRIISMVQGAANGFISASEITGIDPSSGKAWLLKALQVMPRTITAFTGIVDDMEVSISLTRDVKTSQTNLADSDCMVQGGFLCPFTTSGAYTLPAVIDVPIQDGTLVVEPEIYLNIDSTGLNAVCTFDARLYYEEVKLSEVEILRLLTNG